MPTLTKRQKEIVDYLDDYIAERGYAPTLEEIGARFGLSSPATVHKHLTNLESKGIAAAQVESQPRARARAAKAQGRRRSSCRCSDKSPQARPIEAIETPGPSRARRARRGATNSYVLRVKGDSMIDDGILDGDFIVVEERAVARERRHHRRAGQRRGNGQALLREKNGRSVCSPPTSSMAPIVVKEREFSSRGRVVAVLRRVSR